jgi:hypothetical protein
MMIPIRDCKVLIKNKPTIDLAPELTHQRNERQMRKLREHKVWVLENRTTHCKIDRNNLRIPDTKECMMSADVAGTIQLVKPKPTPWKALRIQ